MKATPGPWEIGENIGTGEPVVTFQARDICTVEKRDGEANAALISAAPELYAALESVLQHCVTPTGLPDKGKGRTEAQQAAMDAARAALAKAKGEA